MPKNWDMNLTIDLIAKTELRIDTLETRNSDSLDFHEISVWSIKRALEKAYTYGQESQK